MTYLEHLMMMHVQIIIKHGLQTEGELHKQWHLEQLGALFQIDLESLEYQPGERP